MKRGLDSVSDLSKQINQDITVEMRKTQTNTVRNTLHYKKTQSPAEIRAIRTPTITNSISPSQLSDNTNDTLNLRNRTATKINLRSMFLSTTSHPVSSFFFF